MSKFRRFGDESPQRDHAFIVYVLKTSISCILERFKMLVHGLSVSNVELACLEGKSVHC